MPKPSKSDQRHHNLDLLENLAKCLKDAREENDNFTGSDQPGELVHVNRYILSGISSTAFKLLENAVEQALAGERDPFGLTPSRGIQGRPRWERWHVAQHIVRRSRDIGFESAREEAAELFACGGGPNGSAEQYWREFRKEVEAHERVWANFRGEPIKD